MYVCASFVRKVRGMAAVFEMFYNSVIAVQLRDGAVVFEALAVERVNGRPKHPLIVLAVAFGLPKTKTWLWLWSIWYRKTIV